MSVFTGSAVAIITPFNEDGSIDYDSLADILEWHVQEKTDGIVICGTTGEASTQTDEEQIETIRFTVEKIGGRIPVIAGVGSNETLHAVKLSQLAEAAGADALLHVTPYYNKASTKGLIEHFTTIAASTKLPIILYSVPSRTGVNITPEICVELAKVDNIVGIKEATGNIAQVAEISRVTPDDFDVYSGNDDMIVPLLSVGGKGVISVVANVAPRDTHDMVAKFFDGDWQGAMKLQLDMKPLIDALFIEVNPIPVKAAVSMLGQCKYAYRLPMTTLEQAHYDTLESEMKAYGLI
ncbi:MAG: 4-hydroxy-tetrahydrodipicolinate synthase [Clostridiales Family XIII bacterium]|jgi:4-hydroxy-tetrahydrodipicolinate synthase|nr:4-hydroxy-tetrahydrodipicolinate synthase [Clostridiales Family XIII bacterium]